MNYLQFNIIFIFIMRLHESKCSLLSLFTKPNQFVAPDDAYLWPDEMSDDLYAELIQEVPELRGLLRSNKQNGGKNSLRRLGRTPMRLNNKVESQTMPYPKGFRPSPHPDTNRGEMLQMYQKEFNSPQSPERMRGEPLQMPNEKDLHLPQPMYSRDENLPASYDKTFRPYPQLEQSRADPLRMPYQRDFRSPMQLDRAMGEPQYLPYQRALPPPMFFDRATTEPQYMFYQKNFRPPNHPGFNRGYYVPYQTEYRPPMFSARNRDEMLYMSYQRPPQREYRQVRYPRYYRRRRPMHLNPQTGDSIQVAYQQPYLEHARGESSVYFPYQKEYRPPLQSGLHRGESLRIPYQYGYSPYTHSQRIRREPLQTSYQKVFQPPVLSDNNRGGLMNMPNSNMRSYQENYRPVMYPAYRRSEPPQMTYQKEFYSPARPDYFRGESLHVPYHKDFQFQQMQNMKGFPSPIVQVRGSFGQNVMPRMDVITTKAPLTRTTSHITSVIRKPTSTPKPAKKSAYETKIAPGVKPSPEPKYALTSKNVSFNTTVSPVVKKT